MLLEWLVPNRGGSTTLVKYLTKYEVFLRRVNYVKKIIEYLTRRESHKGMVFSFFFIHSRAIIPLADVIFFRPFCGGARSDFIRVSLIDGCHGTVDLFVYIICGRPWMLVRLWRSHWVVHYARLSK